MIMWGFSISLTGILVYVWMRTLTVSLVLMFYDQVAITLITILVLNGCINANETFASESDSLANVEYHLLIDTALDNKKAISIGQEDSTRQGKWKSAVGTIVAQGQRRASIAAHDSES